MSSIVYICTKGVLATAYWAQGSWNTRDQRRQACKISMITYSNTGNYTIEVDVNKKMSLTRIMNIYYVIITKYGRVYWHLLLQKSVASQ